MVFVVFFAAKKISKIKIMLAKTFNDATIILANRRLSISTTQSVQAKLLSGWEFFVKNLIKVLKNELLNYVDRKMF